MDAGQCCILKVRPAEPQSTAEAIRVSSVRVTTCISRWNGVLAIRVNCEITMNNAESTTATLANIQWLYLKTLPIQSNTKAMRSHWFKKPARPFSLKPLFFIEAKKSKRNKPPSKASMENRNVLPHSFCAKLAKQPRIKNDMMRVRSIISRYLRLLLQNLETRTFPEASILSPN